MFSCRKMLCSVPKFACFGWAERKTRNPTNLSFAAIEPGPNSNPLWNWWQGPLPFLSVSIPGYPVLHYVWSHKPPLILLGIGRVYKKRRWLISICWINEYISEWISKQRKQMSWEGELQNSDCSQISCINKESGCKEHTVILTRKAAPCMAQMGNVKAGPAENSRKSSSWVSSPQMRLHGW